MNCQEFQSRLTRAIESRDAAARAVLANHGEQCPDVACQSIWQDSELVARALSAWTASQVISPPRMVDRVLSALSTDAAAASRRPDVIVRGTPRSAAGLQWWSVGIAAALLVMVGLLLRPATDSRHVAIRPHTANEFMPERSVQIAGQPTPGAAPSEEVPRRESYVVLAHEATYFVTDLAMLVVPVDVDERAETRDPGWVSRLGEKLEPVRTGVEGKLGEWFQPPAT